MPGYWEVAVGWNAINRTREAVELLTWETEHLRLSPSYAPTSPRMYRFSVILELKRACLILTWDSEISIKVKTNLERKNLQHVNGQVLLHRSTAYLGFGVRGTNLLCTMVQTKFRINKAPRPFGEGVAPEPKTQSAFVTGHQRNTLWNWTVTRGVTMGYWTIGVMS